MSDSRLWFPFEAPHPTEDWLKELAEHLCEAYEIGYRFVGPGHAEVGGFANLRFDDQGQLHVWGDGGHRVWPVDRIHMTPVLFHFNVLMASSLYMRRCEEGRVLGILDLETTGFLPEGRIVEIGIAGLDLEQGKVFPAYHTICREPGLSAKDREAWIFSNSDLDPDDVRHGPALSALQEPLQAMLDRFLAVTAYNQVFDFGFLADRGLRPGRNLLDCPMKVATPICRLEPKKYGKWKWPTVEEAWAFLFPDRPYVEKHRGLDDAIHEAKIVYELYRRGHYKVPANYS